MTAERLSLSELEKDTATLDENHIHTLQELFNAVNDLSGVRQRVQDWLSGRGFEDPGAELEALKATVF